MNKDRVLVVDDEEHICELVKAYFSEEFDLTVAYDGRTALEKYNQGQFALVILDIMLPGLNGWDVCRRIRQVGDTPVIMLTAKSEDIDKILGLELGADDYVTKPFNPRELLARAKAVLRRVKGPNEDNRQVFEYPGMMINNDTRQVTVKGQLLELTPKEYELLWLFAGNPGMVFNREHLIQRVWGFDYLGDSRTIDSTVKRLRRKLEAVPGAPFYIQTVWGIGYRFEVPTP
ncbi:MAG: response regulator transcription factor [Thermincolia bacterium]